MGPVEVLWDKMGYHTQVWTERHLWKQYLPHPSDSGGKYYHSSFYVVQLFATQIVKTSRILGSDYPDDNYQISWDMFATVVLNIRELLQRLPNIVRI